MTQQAKILNGNFNFTISNLNGNLAPLIGQRGHIRLVAQIDVSHFAI